MKIALFDMDGVLLASHGYHRALQDTVRMMAQALGFAEVTLAQDEIAAFEATGMTSEWDEAAVSVALLQLEAWRCESTGAARRPPDFGAFARRLADSALRNLGPLVRAERLVEPLLAWLPPERQEVILTMIASARQPQASRTHRLIQEMVVGSREFQHLYGLPAELSTESYLLLHDASYVDDALRAGLGAWLAQPGHAAAIITNRPSRPPDGFFGTPEAELGARLVGLAHLPIAGWGGMTWFSTRQGLDPQTIIKPDALHALAGVQMALGAGVEAALERAYMLSRSGLGREYWLALEGAEILVFEDAPIGLQSGLAAQEVLARAGMTVRLDLHGIAGHAVKREALAAVGAQVHSTLAEALQVSGLASE